MVTNYSEEYIASIFRVDYVITQKTTIISILPYVKKCFLLPLGVITA
jgi:hypothetical protein